jgi:CubicO group peptidase (beta-lactamase class C family)
MKKVLVLLGNLLIFYTTFSQQTGLTRLDSALIEADNIIPTHKLESYRRIESFIVSGNGIVNFEKYYNGADRDSLHHIQSQTKSIVSLLMGIAIDKGFIKGEEEPVSHYFPEYFPIGNKLKSSVRIKDLLTMSAGFEWEEMLPQNDPKNDNTNMFRSGRWLQYALSRPMAQAPFTVFKYNSGNPMIVAGIIEKATGMALDDFAEKYLFYPLGIVKYRWQKDSTGLCHAGGGLYLRPLDMVKIGKLVLNKGKWEDKQIISENWLKKISQPYFSTEFSGYSYGYFWWVKDVKINEKNITKVISAQGAGGQYMYLIPEYELVVSFTERNYGTPIVGPWIFENVILTALDNVSSFTKK